MNARRFTVCLALLAATVLTAGHPAARAQDADAVFERLLAKYNSIDALRAAFTQTMTSGFTDEEQSFGGLLILQGDNYRIETASETLIVNGSALYVYRPTERQVLINDVVEDEISFLPTAFLRHYDERFDVVDVDVIDYDGERHFRLNLQPKDAGSFFTEATLWIRDRDTLITRLRVRDVNETRMDFTLDNVELNPALDADTFEFTPPEGAEVIDLRS